MLKNSWLVLALISASALADEAPRPFAENLLKVEQLPQFRPVVKVGSFSSYDRTGGNDDGFSGTYSFVRKEGDTLVLAELRGPGALTRIWTPTPNDTAIDFYFDDEPTPRIQTTFNNLFSGKTPPFVPPLAGSGAGGHYSFVPLEFAKSIKVVARTPTIQFYQINYVLYEPNVAARTYRDGDSFTLPPYEPAGKTIKSQHVLQPGKAITVFETSQPGRIESLKLGPAESFAGPQRAVVLRIYWDGSESPAVNVPVGDFFGYSFGRPAVQSLLVGAENGQNYVRFPMPFDRSARIELVSEDPAATPLTIESEVVLADKAREATEGYFHAVWRRENPATSGKPFTFLDVRGRGHVVGEILQAEGQQKGITEFFEGDDETTIDGESVVHGTGSEDFFNGGWYDMPGQWNGQVSLPLSGCLEYTKYLGRTGGYRLFLGDAYSFRQSLLSTIEHGSMGNATVADYTGVTFFYLDRPGGGESPLPDLAARHVREYDMFKLVADGKQSAKQLTVEGLTSADATETILGEQVNFIALRRTDKSGDKNPSATFTVDVPKKGRYSICIKCVTNTNSAIIQLSRDGQLVGDAMDFYTSGQSECFVRKLADLDLEQGPQQLTLAILGSRPESSGEIVNIVEVFGAGKSQDQW